MGKAKVTKENKYGLTLKEQKAVKAYIETGNKSEAIRRAGYETQNPDVVGALVFNKPKIREAVKQALVSLRIDESYILSKFKDLAEDSENDIVKVRSLENLASISDLYPDKSSKAQDDGEITVTWKLSSPIIEAEATEKQ